MWRRFRRFRFELLNRRFLSNHLNKEIVKFLFASGWIVKSFDLRNYKSDWETYSACHWNQLRGLLLFLLSENKKRLRFSRNASQKYQYAKLKANNSDKMTKVRFQSAQSPSLQIVEFGIRLLDQKFNRNCVKL